MEAARLPTPIVDRNEVDDNGGLGAGVEELDKL